MTRRPMLPVIVLALLLGTGAHAQAPARDEQAVKEALDQLQEELKGERAQRARGQAALAGITRELAELKRESVDLAARLRHSESERDRLVARLDNLENERTALRDSLMRRHGQAAAVLAALQRLESRPRESLLARPQGVTEAVRSTLALRAVLPALDSRVESLRQDLAALKGLRQRIDTRTTELAAVRKRLHEERRRLADLVARKQSAQRATMDDLKARREAMDHLANKAGSLRELLEGLKAERAETQRRLRRLAQRAARDKPPPPPRDTAVAETTAPASSPRPDSPQPPSRQPPEPPQVTFAPAITRPTPMAQASRTQDPAPKKTGPSPATTQVAQRGAGTGARLDQVATRKPVPIASRRGKLPLPVRGRIVERFGEENIHGVTSDGLRLRTAGGATVIAPHEGRVMFAGPFRRYGQVLIIDHGDGYHSLLAGMAAIDATVGQWVLAGEPVGEMASGGGSRPSLYLELRHDNVPVDPGPWMAANIGKVSG